MQTALLPPWRNSESLPLVTGDPEFKQLKKEVKSIGSGISPQLTTPNLTPMIRMPCKGRDFPTRSGWNPMPSGGNDGNQEEIVTIEHDEFEGIRLSIVNRMTRNRWSSQGRP